MKSKIYTDFSINNILHSGTEKISTIDTNTLNDVSSYTRKASFPSSKRKREYRESDPNDASQRHNKTKLTNNNTQLFETSSIYRYPPYLSGKVSNLAS